MNKRTDCVGLLAALAVCSAALAHPGGITTADPTLPPEGVYLSPSDVHAMYSGPALAIVLSKIQHQPFKDLPPRSVCDPAGGGMCHEDHDFGSSLMGEISVNGSPNQPTQATGRVQTVAYGKGPTDVTGTFDTEMLSMSLTGVSPFGPYMVRESPTLSSLGKTSITDVGGGMYHIDSFFDVFTELSVDGGLNWLPSDGATHVILGIPEPASMALMTLGLAGIAGLTRRRK